MIISIKPTSVIVELEGVRVRLWRGVTDKGTTCDVFVHRIKVDDGQDQEEFARQLNEEAAPHGPVYIHVL